MPRRSVPSPADSSRREMTFFFQAEDGIRDRDVTGVQTCAPDLNIRHTPGVASRAFAALKDINVRMISQGASLLNISLVVAAEDLKSAVESLHREFFTDPDPRSEERREGKSRDLGGRGIIKEKKE